MNSWEKVFFDNIPVYLLIINNSLSIKFKATPLKKYVKLLGGYAFKSSEYQDKGIPIIRISDFQNEKIVLEKAVYYNESEEFEKYELKAGEIIIALTGGTIGKLAIVQSELGKLYLNQRVAKFQVLDINKIANEYVYWIARGVQDNVKKLAWGGAQPNVSSKQIEEMNFPIPDIETQFKIIEFINDLKNNSLNKKVYFCQSVEEKILKIQVITCKIFEFYSEQENQANIITQLKQSILQEAISGQLTAEWRSHHPIKKGDPNFDAKALLAKIKAEKEVLMAEGKLKKEKPLSEILPDDIPFDLPKSWVWCRLGDVCTKIGSGSTPKGSDYSQKGIPFFRSQNIHNKGLVFHEIKYISPEIHEKMSGTAIISGDLLLNITGGSLGRCALVPDNINDGNVSQHVCIIRTLFLNQIFSHFLVLSPLFQKLVFNQTTGAGREGLPKYNLERFVIPLPPLAEQKIIVEKVDHIMKIIDQLEEQIKHRQKLAEDLMQTVLQEAFE
jgi:type I restriction enzyme S subunit